MTKTIAGWTITRINCWHTHDLEYDDTAQHNRVKIEQGDDGLWTVCGNAYIDHQILEQSGITTERFCGPRYAAEVVHQVLGTSTRLTRDYAQYQIGETNWRATHYLRQRDARAWMIQHWVKPKEQCHNRDFELFCIEVDGICGQTLVTVVERFAEIAQQYGYTGSEQSAVVA